MFLLYCCPGGDVAGNLNVVKCIPHSMLLSEKLVIRSGFEKVEDISVGPSTYVFKARNVITGQMVVCKEFRENIYSPQAQRLFLSKIGYLMNLNHPNIEKIVGYTLPELNSMPYGLSDSTNRSGLMVVTEYHDNRSLDQCVSKISSRTDKMIAMFGLASALSYLHGKGLVHGHLHPTSILVNRDYKIVLSGFHSQQELGVFKAPELVSNLESPTSQSDVFSFGMIVLYLFTETIPSATASLQMPNTPISNLIRSCLDQNPSNRPAMSHIIQVLWDSDFDSVVENPAMLQEYAFSLFSTDPMIDKEKIANKLAEKGKTLFIDGRRDEALACFKQASFLGSGSAAFRYGYCLLSGAAGSPKNEREGVVYLQRSADLGYSYGQLWFGHCLKKGCCIPKNEALAFQYYIAAAKQELGDACVSVGKCFLLGIGTPKEVNIALQWFDRAVGMNNLRAMRYSGISYLLGTGTIRDTAKAYDLLVEAGFGGDVKAMKEFIQHFADQAPESITTNFLSSLVQAGFSEYKYMYATALENGKGVEQSVKKSALYYLEAARDGDIRAVAACSRLNLSIAESSMAALKESADAGNSSAQYKYALLLRENGRMEESRHYCKMASDAGETEASILYSKMLYLGIGGPEDKHKAILMMQGLAEEGVPAGKVLVGILILSRQLPRNYPYQHVELFKEAAEAGNADGMFNYGVSLSRGDGCKKNVPKARVWMSKAVALGCIPAICHEALCYWYGYFGFPMNRKRSMELLAPIEKDLRPAGCYLYAKCWMYGIGGRKDLELARSYFIKARDGNYRPESATRWIKKLDKQLHRH